MWWIVKEMLTSFRKGKESFGCLQRLPADWETKITFFSFGTWGLLPLGRAAGELTFCLTHKTAVPISTATYLEWWNHTAVSRRRNSSSSFSELATDDWQGYFLYAEPTPIFPHCASPPIFSEILFKRHCYNKQLRTSHIDGPFRDILAADRRSTTNVLAFVSALKLPLRFSQILSYILMF